jgi:hypothetical protein
LYLVDLDFSNTTELEPEANVLAPFKELIQNIFQVNTKQLADVSKKDNTKEDNKKNVPQSGNYCFFTFILLYLIFCI